MTISLPPIFKNWRFIAIYAVVIVAALSLADLWFGTPEEVRQAEDFCKKNPQIQAVLGANYVAHLERWRHVSSSADNPEYRDFTFRLKNESGKILTVIVRSTGVSNEAHPNSDFSIVAIDG